MNAIVVAVLLMLGLSFFRINVVIALTLSALTAGLVADLSLAETINHFNSGLGGGAKIALSYAMLGVFAVALSQSGLTDVLANKLVTLMKQQANQKAKALTKSLMLSAILLMAVASQNILPIHIAFIPLLIPPLLTIFNQLELDRRAIACLITFGLVTTYMMLPVGFGAIFLNDILHSNMVANGLDFEASLIPQTMLLPGLGMLLGLFIALFITYKKPRHYSNESSLIVNQKSDINPYKAVVALVAIVATMTIQLSTGSMIIGALSGFIIFSLSGVLKNAKDDDIVLSGMKMMAMIGFIMIAASGFASVVKATGQIESLVSAISGLIGDSKALAALLMLLVGLFITMGIGSSFSTIPIIAAIYVPLAASFGFSLEATIVLIATAGALGDAGSPASDSTLGPTAGLNMDGQHDHIHDSVIPTFIHFNIPLLIFGWIAAMTL